MWHMIHGSIYSHVRTYSSLCRDNLGIFWVQGSGLPGLQISLSHRERSGHLRVNWIVETSHSLNDL